MRFVVPLLLVRLALADTSVATAPAAAFACDGHASEWRRQSASEVVRRLNEQVPGLAFEQAAGRRVLFRSRGWHLPAKSVVLDAATGVVELTVPADAAGLAEDGAGVMFGVLQAGRELVFWDAAGKRRWSVLGEPRFDSARAVVVGDLLVVALFRRIASGSSLIALDLRTGARRWRADVLQFEGTHSKYWNDVSVSVSAGVVTLRGVEAGGCYVQTFDLATGRRLSATLSRSR